MRAVRGLSAIFSRPRATPLLLSRAVYIPTPWVTLVSFHAPRIGVELTVES
jgi:hypothetical protein